MSNHTVLAAAEGMLDFSRVAHAQGLFSRLSQDDAEFSLKVAETLQAGEDPSGLIIGRLGKEAAAPILSKLIKKPATVSQRVNALFARYVAIETEQQQAPDNDPHAAALGSVAMAVRDLIFGIRDRTGNADLIAARIMLDLMLHQPWGDMGVFEWEDEERDALGTLECVAAATTGTVRQEARKALATIGVEIEEAIADPCVAFVMDWTAAAEAVNAAPDGAVDAIYHTLCQPFELAAAEGNVPAATTAKGAAVALRKALDFGDMENQDEALVRAALTFLEGEAV